MRKKIVAGNWKMHTCIEEGVILAAEINSKVKKEVSNQETGIIIAPPFTHLSIIGQIVDNERICIAAQNCSSEPKGAFTGEVSAKMLKSFGVKAVILGHSERRAYYVETNEILLKKVNLVLENDLKPIFCCGEKLEERESKNHFNVVKSQIEQVLFNLDVENFSKCIIAYEPVWAIGTGVTASSEQAQEMHLFIRNLIVEKFGKEISENITILYGGSCKPSNSKELFSKPDVDGGLIGGASLDADDFIAIINSF
ncbi:MAG: triose-phosphate isomerase [Bacteroidales bacterium]|nr:triose-phosphate isomerase [Bacteroidales bacterium]MBN2756266.1 triose-phosphate isomerase [Bacteroidales bacterium]